MVEPSMSSEQARELAREILARREYAVYRQARSFLQEWIDALADALRGVVDWVAEWMPEWAIDAWEGFWSGLRDWMGAAFGDDALVVLLRLTLALGVLAAFAILASRMLRELRDRRAEADGEVAASLDAGPRFLEDAEDLARQGRFLEAAHCTQLASLQLLLRKKWLELERSDPNRILRRRLADASLPSAVRERFVLLLDRLEGHWFRDRVEDPELYSEWRVLHEELEAIGELR
jgi:hypothetical protein